MSSHSAPRLQVEGSVTLDGDIVYVNGMLLANLLRAFTAPDTGDHAQRYTRLAITVEDSRS